MTSIGTGEKRRTLGAGWKLEDAKARFSELVRRAREEGPQRVTVRGKDAVVVISAEEMRRLRPEPEVSDWLSALRASGLGELPQPERDKSPVRDPPAIGVPDRSKRRPSPR